MRETIKIIQYDVPPLAMNTLEQLQIEAYNALMRGEDYDAVNYPEPYECETIYVSDVLEELLDHLTPEDKIELFFKGLWGDDGNFHLREELYKKYEKLVNRHIDIMLIPTGYWEYL